MQHNRDEHADIVRALAIWGVVYIHCCYTFLPLDITPFVPNRVFSWAVPVFLILSGFFAAKSDCRPNNAKGILYRIQRLAIPFTVWSLLYFVVHHSQNALPDAIKIISRDFAGYGWSGQYYFIILFQAAFITPLLIQSRTSLTIVIALFAALGLVTLSLASLQAQILVHKMFDDRFIVFWIPHLLLGMCFYRQWGKLPTSSSRLFCWSAVLLASILLELEPAMMTNARLTAWATYQSPIIVAVTPIIFISLCTMTRNWSPKVAHVFGTVGRYSLGIFCLNPLLIEMCHPFHFAPNAVSTSVAFRILCPIITTTVMVASATAACAGLRKLGLRRLVA